MNTPTDSPPPHNPNSGPPQPSTGPSSAKRPIRPAPISRGMLMFILISVVLLLFWLQYREESLANVRYDFFREQLAADNIESVLIEEETIYGTWKKPPERQLEDSATTPPPKADADGEKSKPALFPKKFNVIRPPAEDKDLLADLDAKKVEVTGAKTPWGSQFLLMVLFPILLMLGVLWYIMRRTSDPMGQGGMLGGFIKSPAKRFMPAEQQTTFDDVAAMENAKSELQEVVEYLKNPTKFQKLGAEIPKGILLMGAPGTGKTLLARATAGEAGVPFFSINGSEFIQMFVGVGASRVRDMFRTAKESAPCLIFIDEIDAVGRARGTGVGGGHDEREQTLNQILGEMDGFTPSEAVIVLAATNRPDVLDPALLRPGRFDRHITIDRPSKAGRLGVLKVHTRKVPMADNIDLDSIAGGTIGFSGADLKNLVNEAALHATREGQDRVENEDFEYAHDKVLLGPRREEVFNEHEREMTAYHEAGHALLAWLLPDVDELHKVTIIPRGRSLGVTQLVPDEERYNVGEKRLHAQLAFMLGGRAAEKLVFDEFSAGAEDDLKKATDLARRMVGYWGMSEAIGPISLRHAEHQPFLGKEIAEHQREYSDETARILDQEVQKILFGAAERATQMLTENREDLDKLSQGLLEKEALAADDISEIIGAAVSRTRGGSEK
ncbi:ATP-dependent zinc metalloprotease FtsH [Symmachiella macrocystis]|uniref:ATP-dependent zinc metalloprotease FtsH n=1 Tax=Symmachiella macrocystis TaxID=2527985 RepID=A0A5C6BBS2_9PLAN|nr:ATP-dependent zinc metalloprotease FtsH [Symmachiella macrocystis]TWU08726.1 ATP-dependent zinc metalloprotease FtsH [Symmachiella macrocystis]